MWNSSVLRVCTHTLVKLNDGVSRRKCFQNTNSSHAEHLSLKEMSELSSAWIFSERRGTIFSLTPLTKDLFSEQGNV